MEIRLTDKAQKQVSKLPLPLQNKLRKQFYFLQTNCNHPSLRAKKMAGKDYWEARIDYHYRFIYKVEQETITVHAVGPHDTGLGKK